MGIRLNRALAIGCTLAMLLAHPAGHAVSSAEPIIVGSTVISDGASLSSPYPVASESYDKENMARMRDWGYEPDLNLVHWINDQINKGGKGIPIRRYAAVTDELERGYIKFLTDFAEKTGYNFEDFYENWQNGTYIITTDSKGKNRDLLIVDIKSTFPSIDFENNPYLSQELSADELVSPYSHKYGPDVMADDMLKMKAYYGDAVTMGVFGQSTEGRDLLYISMGTGPKTILVTASIHSREFATTKIAMDSANLLLQQALQGEPKATYLLENFTIVITPMLNPDGVNLAQNGYASVTPEYRAIAKRALQSKSKQGRTVKENILGINLNDDFRKREAVETQYIVKFLTDIDRALPIVVAINLHTSGQVIYRQPNHTASVRLASALSAAIDHPTFADDRDDHQLSGFLRTLGSPSITPELGKKVLNGDSIASNSQVDGNGWIKVNAYSKIWDKLQYIWDGVYDYTTTHVRSQKSTLDIIAQQRRVMPARNIDGSVKKRPTLPWYVKIG